MAMKCFPKPPRPTKRRRDGFVNVTTSNFTSNNRRHPGQFMIQTVRSQGQKPSAPVSQSRLFAPTHHDPQLSPIDKYLCCLRTYKARFHFSMDTQMQILTLSYTPTEFYHSGRAVKIFY
ncbi:hypothetical protein PAAG_02741 [Paracoccidioides lutzii Pb01]|uniref:Uncharacterized protein n=1 Tax=Paracoccidioides lutzii (strain ATCC MYA-826 / Pb01) TaxID=502779 RepID=C1GW46_PARBA|nr:hypothetical protein PAAG_02741 [Paracoccidioides lutzii Pb01]EEH40765.2 hypothetical protein PAAG_02741 [Paracoccidioides lutzii Pb01]